MDKDKKKCRILSWAAVVVFINYSVYLKAIQTLSDTMSAKHNLEICPSLVHYFNLLKTLYISRPVKGNFGGKIL